MLDGMGLIQLYSTKKPDKTSEWHDENPSFCNCSRNIDDKHNQNYHASKSYIPMGICQCGEDTCKILNWTWCQELKQPQTIIAGETVSFHPCYSQGTSVIRGECELQKEMIHYWEIKIVNWLSGTDLMVGIGTDMVDLLEHRYKFSSVLGLDGQSWGFSHRGMVQHKSKLKFYGKPFTKQCIVGIYLDLFRGHLEFYVNRIPQGIAYRNVPLDKNIPIYPMVCSTSAKSSIRLINASSFHDSLQFSCMKIITKYPQLLDKVQQMPGLSQLCRSLWYMLPKERYQYSNNDITKNNFDIPDSAHSTSSTCNTYDFYDRSMDYDDFDGANVNEEDINAINVIGIDEDVAILHDV